MSSSKWTMPDFPPIGMYWLPSVPTSKLVITFTIVLTSLRNLISSLLTDGYVFVCVRQTMFQSKYVESKQNVVNLKSIEAETMSLLLNYAYTSGITITRTNCQNLLSAANLLQVMPVRNAACEFLESHMDTSNCLGICCFAESHACLDLQQKAFDFALK